MESHGAERADRRMDERIRGERGRSGDAIRRIGRSDDGYPVQLREVPDGPDPLYVRGVLRREDALAVAVVGSRRASDYGLGMAEELGRELASRGVTIVSGLARGIDGAAHRGAMRAGGRTVAVLGSGADVIYPPEHRGLAARIAECGAVVSPFAPGTPPLAYHFPIRNRVIAGMALGVVVVEAADKSGALITAGLAAELGREVMAVPGRVTSATSRGTHGLIRDGATLVQGWEDVIAQLPARWRECLRPVAATGPVADAGREAEPAGPGTDVVLSVIGEEAVTMDTVIERSGIGAGRAAALLLELELDGRVRQIEGKRFVQAGRV